VRGRGGWHLKPSSLHCTRPCVRGAVHVPSGCYGTQAVCCRPTACRALMGGLLRVVRTCVRRPQAHPGPRNRHGPRCRPGVGPQQQNRRRRLQRRQRAGVERVHGLRFCCPQRWVCSWLALRAHVCVCVRMSGVSVHKGVCACALVACKRTRVRKRRML